MTNSLDFYLSKEEPLKSCLLTIRDVILKYNSEFTTGVKYGMPTFFYKGKRVCHLWINKENNQPYLALTDGKKFKHPDLKTESLKRMKILYLPSDKDLPFITINQILDSIITLY